MQSIMTELEQQSLEDLANILRKLNSLNDFQALSFVFSTYAQLVLHDFENFYMNSINDEYIQKSQVFINPIISGLPKRKASTEAMNDIYCDHIVKLEKMQLELNLKKDTSQTNKHKL